MQDDTGTLKTDRDQTISDFGDQWTRHTENPDYYGSVELFADIIQPFLSLDDISGAKCADIGSGTGRIVLMMLGAGAKSVTAIEPSRAFDVLVRNTAQAGDRVRCLNVAGEAIPRDDFDIVLSIGVLHHIPDPGPVVQAAYGSLRPGGKMLAWLYGYEGNRAYLSVFGPIRSLTQEPSDRRERSHGLDALSVHTRIRSADPAPAVSAVVALRLERLYALSSC